MTSGDCDNPMVGVFPISAINTTIQSVVGRGPHPNSSHRQSIPSFFFKGGYRVAMALMWSSSIPRSRSMCS